MSYRIAMLGAGSGFTDSIAEGLCRNELFRDATFVLVDINTDRLAQSEARITRIVDEHDAPLQVESATDRRAALPGCDYVVTSCEQNRVPFWIRDIEIPERYGVYQLTGENGGPGGQAHALRNITLFMGICADIRELCPDAWLMNFTNPMSFLCTYFNRFGGVKALGFCHQVHGSFGVVAEMLGMEPGDLQVITGGVNHFNWLLDVRRRGTGKSCMDEFLSRVRNSEYWKRNHPNVPEQKFTLKMLEAFGLYPVGYDDHIVEYLPFFYDRSEWEKHGYRPLKDKLKQQLRCRKSRPEGKSLARAEFHNVPFPKDGDHPHYRETPTHVMQALETNTPLYLDAINIVNHGSIPNLPADAVVDIPAVAVGGQVRGVHVGELPPFAAELCRRQITIHELVVRAAVEGDRRLALQAMALDPYVRGLDQARKILDAFLREYSQQLPQFH